MMTPLIDSPVSPKPASLGFMDLGPGSHLNPSSPPAYERPLPRPPKTPAHAAQIRVRNRRREWLSRHPSYFRSLEHELADPVLYDSLIRRFQSHAEREKEGRAKGFARVLEVDLLRGEARLSELSDDTSRALRGLRNTNFSDDRLPSVVESTDENVLASPRPGSPPGMLQGPEPDVKVQELEALAVQDIEQQPAPQTAEEGRSRWDEFLQRRFVAGRDEDFNYRIVDEDDEYDALERREQEDAWFDNEEPGWVEESEEDVEMETEEKGKKVVVERTLTGETGVQDF
ncbi:coiled-coil domain-containing protein-domain-containing protein [Xylaria sp. CBS 124048]|nr:coiled-coil domain-containing protein-domain-containing protein [Xylaria sp. CBS 124048]